MLPNSTRRTVLVTGASLGIGRAVARSLVGQASTLILTARDSAAGNRLIREIGRSAPGTRVKFCAADLSSLNSVRALAAEIVRSHGRIDVLVNNAGARFDRFQQSVDGHELTFATNHLGHFLLTSLLLDRLLAAPSARIINVSSSAHAGATRPESWLMTAANYDRRQAYARSKLANLLFTFELARRLSGTLVSVNAVHPGTVISGFARNNGIVSWLKHVVSHGLRGELISPRRGADTITYLATSPEVAGVTGKYVYQRCAIESSPLSYESALARDLWTESIRFCGLDSSLGPTWRYFAP